MTFYTPNNIEDLQKLKNLIEQNKDINKLHLNRKIKKKTLDDDLAEKYAPITKLQKEQTKTIKEGQQEQLQAIEDQTKTIKSFTKPPLPDLETQEAPHQLSISTQEALPQTSQFPIEDANTQAIDSDISISINGLLNPINTLTNFKFTSSNINNYFVNRKPFRIVDDILHFDNHSFKITPMFFNLFISVNRENYRNFSNDEQIALPLFVEYAGGLKSDRRSNLYRAVQYSKAVTDTPPGSGVSYVFLSSDPNVLVQRLEVLIGENLAGNKNSLNKASAILNELLTQNEINHQNSEMLELGEEVKKLTEKVQEYEEHNSKNVQKYQEDYDALFAQVQGYIYMY